MRLLIEKYAYLPSVLDSLGIPEDWRLTLSSGRQLINKVGYYRSASTQETREPVFILPKIFERDRVDRIVDISEADARAMTRRLAKEEGILAGMSSGGALIAALKIASEIKSGVIVFIICDRGDRYLSSDLFG